MAEGEAGLGDAQVSDVESGRILELVLWLWTRLAVIVAPRSPLLESIVSKHDPRTRLWDANFGGGV